MSEEEFTEKSLRKIAEQKINFRLSVKIHVLAYVLANIFLVIINLVTSLAFLSLFYPLGTTVFVLMTQPYLLWFLYPIFGWFIGLIMHVLSYVLYARGVLPMAKRGILYNLFGYLTGMLLLTVINLITLPTFLWIIFPGFFWGIGTLGFGIVYFVYLRGDVSERGETKSRKERAIEKEMEKMRRKSKK